jgi:hypothetical protein
MRADRLEAILLQPLTASLMRSCPPHAPSSTEGRGSFSMRDPEKQKASARAWRERNREKVRAYNRIYGPAWRARNPDFKEKARASRRVWQKKNRDKNSMYARANKYGMSIAEVDRMLISQSGRCAACLEPLEATGRRGPHVDHDHATDVVRGILCGDCNLTLGNARESKVRLLRLVDYLNECEEREVNQRRGR